MELNQALVQAIVTITSITVAYFIGRNRDKAEIKRIDAETMKDSVETKIAENDLQKERIDLAQKTIDFYEGQYTKLLEKIETLGNKIKELEEVVEILKGSQCEMENCKARLQFENSSRIKNDKPKKNDVA